MKSLQDRISRRTLLCGSGVALALPWLPSLAWRTARGAADGAPPSRLLYWHIPNGVNEEDWNPSRVGPLAPTDLPRSLRHLADAGVHEEVNVISGIDNLPATPDGFGDHAPGTGGFLTCTPARRGELYVGVSADQLAAQALGHLTAVPSLELSMQGPPGFCDEYPCPLGNAISWSDATTPRAGRRDPRDVWNFLTAGFMPDSADPDELARRERAQRSVLDYVLDQAQDVHTKLGAQDKVKLDQYMTSVRTLERRLGQLPPGSSCEILSEPGEDLGYGDRFAAMIELQLFALQCDLTRIITFMFATSFGPGGMPWAGVSDDFHNLTHAENAGDNREKILKCIDWEVQQIAGFVARCKEIPDGDGTLLDNMALCVSSDVGRGARHNHHQLPVLLAGRGGGGWTTGRHIRFEPEDGGEARRLADRRNERDRAEAISRPNTNRMSNLHLTLLENMGVTGVSLGDSNGTLSLD